MKILILHNAYQQRGGEDTVVEQEAALLRAGGHEVNVEIVSNDAISGPVAKLRALTSAGGNRGSAQRVSALCNRLRPDVVHVHNFFPLLSPAAHIAAAASGAAVVQTLHNYRLLCAGAMFLRDGAVCEDCLGTRGGSALRNRCFRDSLPGTAAVLAMQRATVGSPPWLDAVDRFIALTEFGRSKFVANGLPADKVVVKPNFVDDTPTGPPIDERPNEMLFVGRLSKEKGVRDLVQAWSDLPEVSLKVIGAGPEEAWLRANGPENVEFLGQLPRSQVLERMRQARLLIFPSRWYEGFPMTLAESLASGTPVVAADIGAAREIVSKEFGALFAPGDTKALAAAVRKQLSGDLQVASVSARTRYVESYSPATNLDLLEGCYRDAVRSRAASR